MSTKKAKTKTASAAAPEKKLSLVNAAAAVLERSDEAMTVKGMIEAAKAAGLWTPGAGKTPEQTLYSSILREIKTKGESARFKKEARGHFRRNA
ncbi:MAG: HTH domain-containing protein [Kiritimatiellia bacterium]